MVTLLHCFPLIYRYPIFTYIILYIIYYYYYIILLYYVIYLVFTGILFLPVWILIRIRIDKVVEYLQIQFGSGSTTL